MIFSKFHISYTRITLYRIVLGDYLNWWGWKSEILKNHKIKLSRDSEGVVRATAAWVCQKWVVYGFRNVSKTFTVDLDHILRENQEFSTLITASSLPLRAFVRLRNSIFGLCVHLQIGDIEICNGRIDFKFVLKQSSYIIVYGKNTFGAIVNYRSKKV